MAAEIKRRGNFDMMVPLCGFVWPVMFLVIRTDIPNRMRELSILAPANADFSRTGFWPVAHLRTQLQQAWTWRAGAGW
jgi:hypothetical protein